MKLPPDVQFHKNARLLVYRPRGLLNESAINKVLSALEDLEAELQEPFNRFSDTVAADEIELNFKYVISVFSASAPLLCGTPTGEVGDSSYRFDHDSLRQAACCSDSGFTNQRAHLQRSKRSHEVARRAHRTIGDEGEPSSVNRFSNEKKVHASKSTNQMRARSTTSTLPNAWSLPFCSACSQKLPELRWD